MARIDELKTQLAELDELIRSGVLKGDAARKARERLEAEVLSQVLKPAAGAPAGTDPSMRPSPRLALGLVAFVLAFGAAGYALLGNRAGLSVAPGVAAADGASAPHELGPDQIAAMAQRLADRLQAQPDDVEGWSMLGRSYSVLGRFAEAVKAYKHVVDLRPDDAQGYADYADALGMANGRKLEGEPEKLVTRALQLDANNIKALSLAGTLAFEHGDAASAAKLWERAARNAEPGSELARQLQSVLDEARQRAGLPPLIIAAAAAPPAAAASGPPVAGDAAAGSVKVRVTLAPALAAKASPDDTVFIFARALQGPKAPLAIQRRQVKDLPLDLTLDDSMAMSPALRLSTVSQVVVGARISKSGNAMPQPGDLQGLSPTVAVGARDVEVEIADVVH